ncbi:MAG: hypothetical protein RIQ56_907 [Candidatus Parcubacteria bacterium]
MTDNFPKSPISGQPFNDLHPVFSLLRGDSYVAKLRSLGSAQAAMDFLYDIDSKVVPGLTVNQSSSFPAPQAEPIAFISNNMLHTSHWTALFQMLSKAGYTDTSEILQAARTCITRIPTNNPKMDSPNEVMLQVEARMLEAFQGHFGTSKNFS